MSHNLNVKERINKLIQEIIGDRAIEISDDFDLVEDLGIDSIEMMELLVKIENIFDVCIPDEKMDTDELRTYENLVEIITSLVEK